MTTPTLSRKRSRMSPLRRRRDFYFYVFLTPWLIGLVIFRAGPMIASALLSLMRWEVLRPPAFVGLENWRTMFGDPLFWLSLRVTFVYTMGVVPLGVTASFLLALLMNQNVRGITVFRTIYYLPSVVSGVSVAMLWLWIFNPQFGLLNHTLAIVGIKGPGWVFDKEWVLPALVIMSLWGVGGNMIIYLSGLQGIPTHLYEAAQIDGAGRWRSLMSITVPLMTPIVFFNLVMTVISSFQVFTAAFVMTAGGPSNASLFYVLYLFRNAFQYFRMGYASALAWVLFVIIGFFTLLIFRSADRWVYYEGGAQGAV
jgi:multiple sugar transport system permease protein